MHDGDSMVASGRHGGMTRKLRANFFNLKYEGEGVGRKLEITSLLILKPDSNKTYFFL